MVKVSCAVLVRILLLSTVIQELNGGPQEDKLLKKLFEDYNPVSRPVVNDSAPVVVGFKMEMQQIIKLDERNELLESVQWLHFEWDDSGLVWKSEDYDGLSSLVVPADTVWKPDILLYNTVDEEIDSRYQSNVYVSSSGRVIWIPPSVLRSSCAIDIHWFPFDTQVCRMKFGSWTYGSEALNLTLLSDTVETSTYQKNGEWDLIDITLTLQLRRRANFYVLTVLIPCSFVTILTLFNFLQPADSGEKIGLGITILLSLSVFQLIVADMIPRTSISVPVLGAYFCGVMCLCTISLIMTLLTLKCHHTKPEMQKMPLWMHVGVCKWLAWFMRMQRPGLMFQEENRFKGMKNTTSTICRSFKTPDVCLEEISRDSIIVISSTPSSNADGRLLSQRSNTDSGYDVVIGEDSNSSRCVTSSTKQELKNVTTQLKSILKELRILTDRVTEEKRATSEANDWQFAALVVDRLCFWICTLVFIVGTSFVFCYVP